MADRSGKREYRVKPGNTGGKADIKGMDVDPGKEIKTRKDAAAAKQDMEFGEAMEADMNGFSRDMERGRPADEGWKGRARYDGNKNLEIGQDLTFIDKMYNPVLKSPDKDNEDNEFGEDGTYLRNSNGDRRSIEQRRSKNRDNKEK